MPGLWEGDAVVDDIWTMQDGSGVVRYRCRAENAPYWMTEETLRQHGEVVEG